MKGILRLVETLRTHPELGAVSVDLGPERLYRSLSHGRHRVFCRLAANEVLIVRIWDGRRDPRDLKLE